MTIAVDFDGTIVEHAYPKIGKPIPFAIDVLKKLQKEQHTLLLWTVREGGLLQDAIDYCEQQGLTFYAANKNYPEEETENAARKLTCDLFIDDRNIGGLPDWGVIYNMIKTNTYSSYDMDSFMSDDSRPQKKKNFFIRLGEAWDKAQGRRY